MRHNWLPPSIPCLPLATVATLLLLTAAPAGASASGPASVIGPPEVRSAIESFAVPTLPRPVRIRIAPCPGDPAAQGCHSSGGQMDTIWLNPEAGGLDTETVAHEMGHVFESYMWDLRWEGVPKSACARFSELSEPLYTGYYGFEMSPEQHDQICPLIDRMALEYEAAIASTPTRIEQRPGRWARAACRELFLALRPYKSDERTENREVGQRRAALGAGARW